MNAALANARGEFIQYLDADDILGPDKIELQLRRVADARDCVAASEWARFHNRIDEAEFEPDDNWRDMAPVDWLVSAWRDGGGMLFPAMWLIPRPVIDQAGPWREDLTLNNDGEYFCRIVLASAGILFCAGARAYYRSGLTGSVSGMKSNAGWVSQRKSLEACERYLLEREDSDRTRRVVAFLWQRFAHASYPYAPDIGNDAERRARRLHPAALLPQGGPMFRQVMRIAGWRFARRIQRFYYGLRYGRS